ncbi:hypothetical protein SLNWT_2803 [Streptomyces albus]|uniref:Uncharacterized protein n=1 Tax=Streptomyces albus (strain ATCC 21838 / DSM 41398 / FERM P-419 / JCM 4703 / NBRC 107858) TaxID=1081613 RepID=A0A0B5ENI0_STRA4|nr:hypothetical protein SLNWT_2803 [Streptomyces albus]AOU77490.1 hypothetical protein SLNHY_2799 [Streptomyces albus]AYN33264.1 hypothetical protein DUI70_2762 [Streptomyces albus]
MAGSGTRRGASVPRREGRQLDEEASEFGKARSPSPDVRLRGPTRWNALAPPAGVAMMEP